MLLLSHRAVPPGVPLRLKRFSSIECPRPNLHAAAAGPPLRPRPRPRPLFPSPPPTPPHPLIPRTRRLSTAAATAGSEDPKLSRIAEELLTLSPAELDDYAALLRLKLRLSLTSNAAAGAGPAAAGDAASGDAGAEEATAAKTAFDVKIEKYEAAAKIKIIKEVRTVTDLGLKEAKELVEKAGFDCIVVAFDYPQA